MENVVIGNANYVVSRVFVGNILGLPYDTQARKLCKWT